MGSTVVALKSHGKHFQVSWVGDSRAYRWQKTPDGPTFSQLSTDHSYVQSLFDSGVISEAEMATHPEKNIITQCLGSTSIDSVTVDSIQGDWQEGDRVLLCSDGLSDAVDDQTICNIMSEHLDHETCVRALINKALENGGHDNVSVIIVGKPRESFLTQLSQLFCSKH